MVTSETVATEPEITTSRTHLFVAYAAIAYLVSWAIEIPLALKAQRVYSGDIPFAIHYLAAFGPGIAGIILTWRETGAKGLRDLLARSVKWRVAPTWWIVALSPLLGISPWDVGGRNLSHMALQ